MPNALDLLIAERDRLEEAIALLQGTAPRRGRPPGRKPKKAARRTNTMSAAQRKAISKRMKAYWAARKGKKAKKVSG